MRVGRHDMMKVISRLVKHKLTKPVGLYEYTPMQMREIIFEAISGHFHIFPEYSHRMLREIIRGYVPGVVPPTLEELKSIVPDLNEMMGLKEPLETWYPDKLFMLGFDKVVRMAESYDNFHEDTWAILERYGAGPERKLKTPVRRGDRRLEGHIYGPKAGSMMDKVREFLRAHEKFTYPQLRQFLRPLCPDMAVRAFKDRTRNYISRMKRDEGWRITRKGGTFFVLPPERIE